MTARTPRAVWVFALVALGVTGARWVEIDWFVALAVAAPCALAALCTPRRLAWACAALALVGAAGSWASLRWHGAPGDRLDQRVPLAPHERELVSVRGYLLETPRSTPTERGALGDFARFGDDAQRARMRLTGEASGVVRLRIDAGAPGVRAGDAVRVTGWYTPVRPPANPGGYDFTLPAAERTEVGSIGVPRAELVVRTEGDRPFGAHAASIVDRVRGAARRALPEEDSRTSALLNALVLGERGAAYRELNDPFARSGLAHVLAISGMHLGVLAGLGVLAVRLTGDRPRLEALAVLVLVVLVLVLVPARAPIVRAGVIAIALTLGALAGRRFHPVALLSWAAVAIVAWRPSELFSPGFQLSFGVVAALVTLAPRCDRRWFGAEGDPNTRTGADRALLWLRRAVSASVVAWLVSLPLVAHAFGIVSWLAPVTAVLAVPVAGLILAAGYGAVIVELVVPGSAGGAGGALLAVTEPLLALVRGVDAIGWASASVPRLGGWWTACATGVIVWALARGVRARAPLGEPAGARSRVAGGAMGACALGVAVWTAALIGAPGVDRGVVLRVDALALGDGSCYFVRSGDEAMLFDCGSRWTGAGVRAIPDAARALGVPPITDAVVSHPDIDHYACLQDAAERLGVRTLVVGERFMHDARERPGGPTATLLGAMDRAGVTRRIVGPGEAWTLGDARVEVLAPALGAAFDRDNDHALVLRITAPTDAGARTVLFVGDLEDDGIRALRERYPRLRADVVEAPHHGSAREVASAFVASLGPSVVIQSTGPSRLGHPVWAGVRERASWWTTAVDGAVGVEIGVDGSVRAFSPP